MENNQAINEFKQRHIYNLICDTIPRYVSCLCTMKKLRIKSGMDFFRSPGNSSRWMIRTHLQAHPMSPYT